MISLGSATSPANTNNNIGSSESRWWEESCTTEIVDLHRYDISLDPSRR